MEDSVQRLTESINNSILFSLDKDAEPSRYNAELNILTGKLYQYVNTVYHSSIAVQNNELNLRFWKTVLECVKSYDPEAGPFLNYFNVAISREVRYAERDIYEQANGGLHIEQGVKKTAKLVADYLRTHPEMSEQALWDKLDKCNISVIDGVSCEEIKNALRYLKTRDTVSLDAPRPSDDDSGTISDTIAAEAADYVQELLTRHGYGAIFAIAEQLYEKASRTSKRFISIRLTNQIVASGDHEYYAAASTFPFFAQDIVKLVLNRKKELSKNEIAAMSGKTAANCSKIWGLFCTKVVTELKARGLVA